MSDNFIDVRYELLLKEVGLLRGELGSLLVAELDDEAEQTIMQARGCALISKRVVSPKPRQ